MTHDRIPYRATFIDDASRTKALDILSQGLPSYGGIETEHFEVELAEVCGTQYGVTTNSGTSALLLILWAAGISNGDEVILGANDYIGCLSAIAMVGARPVFVDTEPDTGNLDVTLVADHVNHRSRAIIATHLYGHPCDVGALAELARARGLLLIEDFAHALGARFSDQPVGGVGRAGFCSFSGKHITVFGPGGVAVTGDADLAETMSSLRDQGRNRDHRVSFVRQRGDTWYDQQHIGLNLHLSEVSAALGRRQLQLLPQWNVHRRASADYYGQRFRDGGLSLRLPPEKAYAHHAYLHYTVMTPQRDALRTFLEARGIETQVHYPRALHHLRPVQERWPHPHDAFPNAARVASEVLSLPVGPHMDAPRLERVASAVEAFFEADGS